MFYGLDLHKEFIQVSQVNGDGKEVRNWKIATDPEAIRCFGKTLGADDAAVMETTFNTWAVYDILKNSTPARVVVANSLQVKAIAFAKVKTDRIDARILAQLLRSDFIPEVQAPDPQTKNLRELTVHRKMLTKHRTSFVNGIRAVLNKRLLKHPKALFGPTGKQWLDEQALTKHERFIVDNYLELLKATDQNIKRVDEEMIKHAKVTNDVRLLMTIPGVGLTAAIGIRSAIGEVDRFQKPDQLASYFGLVPRVSQSADRCYFGRITKAGNPTARWLAIEAAQQMAISGAPLTATYYRIRKKKGHNVAVTAVARKLIVLCWHMLKHQQPYRYTRLTAQTKRKLSQVTKNYRPGNRWHCPRTAEEYFKWIELPAATEPSSAEKRVLKVSRQTITAGKKSLGFDKIDRRNRFQKSDT